MATQRVAIMKMTSKQAEILRSSSNILSNCRHGPGKQEAIEGGSFEN